MKEGRKPEYPEKTPGDELQKMPHTAARRFKPGGEETGVPGEKIPGAELQKMPHTTAQRFKPQARLEPAQQHWWQARKAVCLFVVCLLAA